MDILFKHNVQELRLPQQNCKGSFLLKDNVLPFILQN